MVDARDCEKLSSPLLARSYFLEDWLGRDGRMGEELNKWKGFGGWEDFERENFGTKVRAVH